VTPPLCPCHGLPKWWQTDRRKKLGGYWVCGEAKRERQRQRYAADPTPTLERMARNFRHRYDSDPIWRISRNLQRARENRAARLARRRQRLEESDRP